MSDWRQLQQETEEKIAEFYPFLRPRDHMGKILNHYPMINLEIPFGWYDLFFQMCDDIREVLIKMGKLDKYYFIQVKEKYGVLLFYGNKDIPLLRDIANKYRQMSAFICVDCGAPAKKETIGYIEPVCDECVAHRQKLKPNIKIKDTTEIFDKCLPTFADEWERYTRNL